MYENAVGKFLTYAEAETKTMAMREMQRNVRQL